MPANNDTTVNMFRAHIPGFVDDNRPRNIPFSAPEKLFNHPDIVAFTELDEFVEFALSTAYLFDDHPIYTIVATYNDGYRWIVVGYVDNPIDLPEWKAKYRGGGQ